MDEALGYFQQGVALRPERPDLHLNLARAYVAAGRAADAIAELQVAVSRAPAGSEVEVAAREELRRLGAGG